ncbi:hypothetical protein C0L75_03305 [Clostridium perfringens]
MGKENLLDMGYKVGKKLSNKKDWIKEQASILTCGTINVGKAKEFMFQVATEAEEPIPLLLTKTESQLKRQWTDILCYITGVYNGCIKASKNTGKEFQNKEEEIES